MAPLGVLRQPATVQLSLKGIPEGGEKLKSPELVSSPSGEFPTEEIERSILDELVVCLKAIPSGQFKPKKSSFEDKFTFGIQGCLDEETSTKQTKGKEATSCMTERTLELRNEGELERAAVEHYDDCNDSAVEHFDDCDVSAVSVWKSRSSTEPKDDCPLAGVHVSPLLLVDLPVRSPVQESACLCDDSSTADEKGPPSVVIIDSSEEVAPEEVETESSDQLVAEVKVDREQPVRKPSRKRHMNGRVKRNIYLVVPNNPPIKKRPRTRASYQPKQKKARLIPKHTAQAESEDLDSLIAEFLEHDAAVGSPVARAAIHHNVDVKKGFRSSQGVSYNTPRDSTDSGVESGSSESNNGCSSNGSSDGNGSNEHGSPTSGGGGGNSGGGNSGRGNSGGDDQENGDNSKEKVEASVMIIDDHQEDDETDEDIDERMEEDDDVIEEHVDSSTAVDVDFDEADLQHACYCRPGKACRSSNCNKVNEIVKHMETHKDIQNCKYCARTWGVINVHASVCAIRGCRVPHCTEIRQGKYKVTPAAAAPPGVPRPGNNHVQYTTRPSARSVDGWIVYRNADFMRGGHFQEHIDYHVQRNKKLGEGSNGKIFKMFTRDHRRQLVVKETSYAITMEEINVYRALKSHENIVDHYGVAFKGSDGEASIFMEECGLSLYDYIHARGRLLDCSSAMYFWCQVLDAVVYMHNLPVPIIHKDIKAKNVLLCEECTRAKLADFDSAKTLPDEFTKSGLDPMGTKGFAAPEVLARKPHGTPADIHELGCFLLELTVGVPLNNSLYQKIEKLRMMDSDLADLVTASVNPSPQERPTAMEVKQSAVVQRYQAAVAL